jgi:hypothetical protein
MKTRLKIARAYGRYLLTAVTAVAFQIHGN